MSNMDARQLAGVREIFKEFDPTKLTTDVASLGETWADQDSAASGYEESRKSVLAQLILEYSSGSRLGTDGKAKPVPFTMAEQQALADERYRLHLDMMVDARRASNVSRVRYDMGKMKLELMRSLQATIRQEMHMAGGR